MAVHDDGRIAGTVTWCPPGSPWRDLARRPEQAEFRMLSVAAANAVTVSGTRSSRPALTGRGRPV